MFSYLRRLGTETSGLLSDYIILGISSTTKTIPKSLCLRETKPIGLEAEGSVPSAITVRTQADSKAATWFFIEYARKGCAGGTQW